jgi:hypothetical protein
MSYNMFFKNQCHNILRGASLRNEHAKSQGSPRVTPRQSNAFFKNFIESVI